MQICFCSCFLCTNFMQVKPTNCFRKDFLKLWKFKNWLSRLFLFYLVDFDIYMKFFQWWIIILFFGNNFNKHIDFFIMQNICLWFGCVNFKQKIDFSMAHVHHSLLSTTWKIEQKIILSIPNYDTLKKEKRVHQNWLKVLCNLVSEIVIVISISIAVVIC